MAQVLAKGNTVSVAALKKADSDSKATEEKLGKVEAALEASREKVKKKVEELVKKDEELDTEKKKLVDLKADWKPTTKESKDISRLKTRAEMVDKIESLKLDCLEMAEADFKRAVEQLKHLNPDLKMDNIELSSKTVDG
ncbi:uncharacterized protein LOC131654734 [Vicia villosa]|uniref:uncharacterized protein LOC131654734 n=1 Tax=Vicia villosa TaxID=3911 RepID=UPI00273C9A51|nr:uncharacterized protein LOC131654734 [Vicia villosa]